jgi:oxygen-independent coproporphyrinogen-3 oxidase
MSGLYIHIPFCERRCAYCDFYSTVFDAVVRGAYVDALRREMTARAGFLPSGRLDTIYVGGGTPTLLAPEALRGLLDHAGLLWDCSTLRETTLEANPEDLSDDYLSRLAATGFNRLSIGVQSFDDGLLRLMNRRHDASRAREAVRVARRVGFDNISIDLIWGIPGMTSDQWLRTLDEAVGLGVQHVSAYHLTIEPGTAFGRKSLKPVAEAESERQFSMLRQKLGEAGFEHYEISNFALPGRRAVHNSAYWSGEAYLGVGPSAHSFDGGRRREWVAADVKKYLTGFSYGGETLSDTERRNEKIMTALRTADGIALSELSTHAAPGPPRGGWGRCANQTGTLDKFLAERLLVKKGDRVAIPPDKFLLSDYIISALFDEESD